MIEPSGNAMMTDNGRQLAILVNGKTYIVGTIYARAETLFCPKSGDRNWLESQSPDVVSRVTSLFFRSWFGGKTAMLKQLTNQMQEQTERTAGTLKPPSISPTGLTPSPMKRNRAQRRSA